MNLSVVQVYAPANSYDDDTVEEFYELIEQTLISKKDFIIIQGDWNAKVGGDGNEALSNATGRYSLGITDERGLRLLEFAQKHKLYWLIFFILKKILGKVHSPDDKTHNHINFILTPQRFKSSINNESTRTYSGADIYSDHDLVLCNLQIKLKRSKKGKCYRIRYDVDKLLNPEVKEIFQKEIKEKLTKIDISN